MTRWIFVNDIMCFFLLIEMLYADDDDDIVNTSIFPI